MWKSDSSYRGRGNYSQGSYKHSRRRNEGKNGQNIVIQGDLEGSPSEPKARELCVVKELMKNLSCGEFFSKPNVR